MKAFLLAAGLGTRLRPLTHQTPKCLLPIGGKPLLSIWLSFCQESGIREVLINTHHLAEQVRTWAVEQDAKVRLHLVHEPELLGSAGTVLQNWHFVAEEEDFFVFYADNLVKCALSELLTFHRSHSDPLTMTLFEAPCPEECGIVTLDGESRIVDFVEKPRAPKSNLANAGIYVARAGLREYLARKTPSDFGKDVLPRLIGKARGFLLRGYLRDIGTPEAYQLAQKEWERLTGATANG